MQYLIHMLRVVLAVWFQQKSKEKTRRMANNFGYPISWCYSFNGCRKEWQFAKIRLIQTKHHFPIFTKSTLTITYFHNLSRWIFYVIKGPKLAEILFIYEFSVAHIDKGLKEKSIEWRLTVPFDDDSDYISALELVVYNLCLTFELQTKVTNILLYFSLSLHPILYHMLFLFPDFFHPYHSVWPMEDILCCLLISYGWWMDSIYATLGVEEGEEGDWFGKGEKVGFDLMEMDCFEEEDFNEL